MTYSEFHRMCLDMIGDPKEREKFAATADPKHLLEAYLNGQNWQFTEYQLRDSDGKLKWVNLSFNLLRHPISGDIFAFGYYRNIDVRRRWELELSAPLERDSATLLYTMESMEAMFQVAVSHMTADEVCAISVFEILGFEQYKSKQGITAAQKLLFTIGRLCRINVEGSVIPGHLDETRFVFFRTDAASSERQRVNVENYRERTKHMISQTLSDLDFDIACGYATCGAEDADYNELLRRASVACELCQQWPNNPVTEYVDPETGDAGHQLQSAPDAGKRILIADDDELSRTLLSNALSTDYTVETAENGREALDMLAKKEYVLLICDIQMPVMDGWEVISTLSRNKTLSTLPVVVITSDLHSESEVKALNMGATDVIVKPFVAKTLRSRVRNIIGRHESARITEQNRFYELRFQQQANMLHVAEYDELSGLLNRQGFYRHARELLDSRPATDFRLIRWDLDNFKVLNDALGVETGDRLLRYIGKLLRDEPADDTVQARLDADHFICLTPEGGHTAEELLERISLKLSDFMPDFRITLHMGVYHIKNRSLEISIMCDRALMALRSVKGSFTNRIAYYDATQRNKLLEEQELAGEMASALANGQFKVYFQPQFNYANGKLIGAEALVRWMHPKKGMLSPITFIPLFERNGFVAALDEYVWEQSCLYMRRWSGSEALPVSVNISRIDIYNPNLCRNLVKLMNKYQLPFSQLKLEITESAYMQNPTQLISVVKELQSAGFTVEMDDFGSGYSSLNTLKDVPVEILKLDMRFITEVVNDSRGGNILSSVIRMAHWLKLPVIAEGVETKVQADYLKSLGCFYMQGFYFGRPMPPEEFEKLFSDESAGHTDRYDGVNLEGMAAFWDASAQNTLLFNSLMGGAAILEYRGNTVEILRANDSFFKALGTTRETYSDRLINFMGDFDSHNRTSFKAMLDDAVRTGGETGCEVVNLGRPPEEKPQWIRSRAKLLTNNCDSYLIYVAVENVTSRREAERKRLEVGCELQDARGLIRRGNELERLVMKYLSVLLFNYDYSTDTLYYSLEDPENGSLSREIHNSTEQLALNVPVHPTQIQILYHKLSKASLAPMTGSFEYILNTQGRSIRRRRGYYSTIAGPNGRVNRMVGLIVDSRGAKGHSAMPSEPTVCRYDIASRTLYLPADYSDLTGFPRVLNGIPYSDMRVLRDYRDVYISFYEKIFRGEKTGSVYVRFAAADGSVLGESLDFVTTFDDDNAPSSAAITIEEITRL